MKKLICFFASLILFFDSNAQCVVNYTYSISNGFVNFTNLSAVSNARYFWNFGDGTGSNAINPLHKFPETGSYFVSLYAKDTLGNCSDYKEYWISFTKNSNDPCISLITDSVFSFSGTDYLKVIDNSSNCSGYNKTCDGGPALNSPMGNWIYLGGYWKTMPFRMVARGKYAQSSVIKRMAYKSSFHNYVNNKHYTPCSANFEFKVVSESATNQRILFKAMNSQPGSFYWSVAGFGPTINSTNDTISVLYPKNNVGIWQVGLYTIGSSSCKDSLWQNIRIQDSASYYTTTALRTDQI